MRVPRVMTFEAVFDMLWKRDDDSVDGRNGKASELRALLGQHKTFATYVHDSESFPGRIERWWIVAIAVPPRRNGFVASRKKRPQR